MVEIPEPRLENIVYEPRIDLSLLKKRGKANTFEGYLIARMKEYRNKGSFVVNKIEFLQILQELYNKHKELEKIGITNILGWKGTSDLKLIKRPDLIEVYKWQKKAKGEEPKEIKYEITKKELNAVLVALNHLNDGSVIKTEQIAREFCQIMDIKSNKEGYNLWQEGEFKWSFFFSDRSLHCKLTIILDVLDQEGFIEYKGGKSKVLKDNLEIQEILR